MLVQCVFNLRQQAESQHRRDRMYKPRDKNYITWSEAQQTRINVLSKVEAMDTQRITTSIQRENRLRLAEDALIVSFHVCAPPDRVGVIRRLTLGKTLKPDEEDNRI